MIFNKQIKSLPLLSLNTAISRSIRFLYSKWIIRCKNEIQSAQTRKSLVILEVSLNYNLAIDINIKQLNE
ncbi:hypothetical protein HNR74_002230 [Flammeovirga kamogawensis]|nr:hypothetical protein [Flammeovirga kamogawensis]